MNIYYRKKIYTVAFSLFFFMVFVLGLYVIYYKGNLLEGIIPIITSPILAYIYFKMANEVIITTDAFIKKITFKKEEVCNWEWIRAIKTRKYYSPYYACYTYIYWSRNGENQKEYQIVGDNKGNEQNGELVIKSHFSNYKQLLNYIVSKTKDIEIDDTTRKIIEKVKK